MMDKPVVKAVRTIALDADLKNNISDLVKACDPDAPAAREARERSLAMAEHDGNLYRFALELRTYLEEKSPEDKDCWVFPLAGDLYLHALETNLAGIGPNFFRDHYLGLLGCFRDGYKLSRSLQAPFYCVDLILHRMVMLHLDRHRLNDGGNAAVPQFISFERPGYAARMEDFFTLARQILADGVSVLLSPEARREPKQLVDELADMKESQEKTLKCLAQLFPELEEKDASELDTVLAMCAGVKSNKYRPIEAVLHEELGHLHRDAEDRGETFELDAEDSVHHYYEAADRWVAQGDLEREANAFDLALRRHKRAVSLFYRIHDRTSAAKALVEKARTLIEEGIRGELVRAPLREAVRLVLASKRHMPAGQLPAIDDGAVHTLLVEKGYAIEAEAFSWKG